MKLNHKNVQKLSNLLKTKAKRPLKRLKLIQQLKRLAKRARLMLRWNQRLKLRYKLKSLSINYIL